MWPKIKKLFDVLFFPVCKDFFIPIYHSFHFLYHRTAKFSKTKKRFCLLPFPYFSYKAKDGKHIFKGYFNEKGQLYSDGRYH